MTVDDIDYMIDMGSRMHNESTYSEHEFSEDKCRSWGHQIIASAQMCGFVSEQKGVIVGMFLGCYWAHHFLDATTSSDLLIYVDEKHRGGLTGYRLVKKYIDWCKSCGVDDIRLGESAGINRESIDRLYTKLGFSSCGTLYKMNKE